MLGISQLGGKKAMMGRFFSRQAALAAAFLLALGAAAPAAHAADVKVMSTVALTPTLGELIPKFESGSGNKLIVVYSTIADLKKRIEAGETADVMILSRAALEGLLTQGKVAEGSIVNVGRSYVAVGVHTGAPKPDISTVEKLKAALLAAKSISYADPAKGGASGIYFAKVIERLGIADQMKSKTVLVPGAEAGELVAKGEVEMGVAQASEIAAVPGAQVVGPLPGDLNSAIVFAVGIGSTSKDPAAARSLIEFLTGPAGSAVLKSKGMDPA
ncbi:molybdate ABC transporter substrate-binding protein [Bradyrhizobium sp. UFLA03-84]|uniref:molybdate ABC transporter substrate-binding protein n=1 Tax=Bradyrhizobium sp. UFLA03-84 TaxID=418599 RepID=UPI00130470AE|nr:molybdate ABC transporter substrate-binding protein [Bradyrhizobium sp. UFLA03-84]